MNTEAIARRLVELCRQGKYEQAQDELYADDAVSIEMDGLPPDMARDTRGLEAIREKGRQFNATIEAMHGGSVGDPIVTGNWFSLVMTMDATFKGRGRVDMREICVYQVRDGKIVREQFFYDVD
ncbi:SnoaL-like domain-containing protein [Dokdonella ginsengisoli]|uniref:SnoaL-like domain-containing protein n=1 Tax=Dokdonella ginsengisoli TaxID=363846 RepID=A0ABV9QS53_9GAMM